MNKLMTSLVSVLPVIALAGFASAATTAKTKSLPPLVIATGGSSVDNFNPLTGGNLSTQGLLYESLFAYNDFTGGVTPLLGTSYQWSQGNKVLTVQLRKHVQWSNGSPFTSADVVYTFDLMKKYPALDSFGIWPVLKSVQAIGDYTVQFTFVKPNVPYATYILGDVYPVPESVWSHLKTLPYKYQNEQPVTDGPYMVKSFTPQSYSYKVNPKYWGPAPAAPVVEFPLDNGGTEETTIAMEKGNIDWADWFVPNIQKVWIAKDPKQRGYWYPTFAPMSLIPDLKNPVLKNVVVRKAISLALNRPEIASLSENGYARTSYPTGLSPQNFTTWLDPSLPASDKAFTYNPKQAKQMLLKAGYKMGSDGYLESPQGKPLPALEIASVSGFSDWEEAATLVATELKAIGLDAYVQDLAFGTFYSYMASGKVALSTWGFSGDGPSPYYFYDAYLTPSGGSDFEGWHNKQTNALLAQYQQTTDKATQKHDMYQLEKIFAQNLPIIPVYGQPDWNDYDTQRYTGWPTSKNPYATIIFAGGSGWSVMAMHLKAVK